MRTLFFRRIVSASLILSGSILCGGAAALLGSCGPFTDVAADAFCPFVLEIFYLGITTGTTATTYDPSGNVTRLQMAAFLSRTVDNVLKRGSRRAALNQFFTQKRPLPLFDVTLDGPLGLPASDGVDIWVPAGSPSNTLTRVHASDGDVLRTWTAATNASAAIDILGHVFITGATSPGGLYHVYPPYFLGAVLPVTTNLGGSPRSLAYDGSAIWTANAAGSISTVTVIQATAPAVSTVTAGFSSPLGVLYDGASIWITDNGAGTLLKLDAAGAILQTVSLGGAAPGYPVFDGANIWVPNGEANSVSVVRASTGAVLATLTGNGLDLAFGAAFDGQRLLVTNLTGGSVSLWKAADLTPLGSVSRGGYQAKFACSDGNRFWVTFAGGDNILVPF